LLFDIADTVDSIGSNPLEWDRRGYGACNHCRRKLWFGRKAGIGGHVGGFQAIWIVGPLLRKIQRAIDERVTVARNVGSEDSDLAVRDLACGTSVLPRHSARCLALLEKAGLVDHEDRVVIRQMLEDIIPGRYLAEHQHPNPCDPGSPVAAKDRDRQPPPRASSRFCVAHLRADLPETSLHSSQHALA